MQAKIKIVSLNIEFNKHYSRIYPFLFKQNPDVVLLQEVLQVDIKQFQNNLKMDYVFAPLAKVNFNGEIKMLGIATFSRFKIGSSKILYYRGKSEFIPITDKSEPEKLSRALLVSKIVNKSVPFTLINTHFTWSDGGIPTQVQKDDLEKLLNLLLRYKDFVLCGDFNAPRGGEIFDKIAFLYKDNIPKNINTTIDKTLHSAGDLRIVVDGLFTTGRYAASKVKVVGGVSDHMAVVAEIEKLQKN